jgi:hypothetical protein
MVRCPQRAERDEAPGGGKARLGGPDRSLELHPKSSAPDETRQSTLAGFEDSQDADRPEPRDTEA